MDDRLVPIAGTERRLECDALILSVGLIPENELAESLGIPLDGRTKGPVADQNCMTLLDGVFSCGNALHVSDLADYVSESGEAAGRAAARYVPFRPRAFAELTADGGFLYIVPQKIDLNDLSAPRRRLFPRRRRAGQNAPDGLLRRPGASYEVLSLPAPAGDGAS